MAFPLPSSGVIVAAVALSGALSAAIDLRSRRIPNWLTGGIAAAGLLLAALGLDGLSVGVALAGAALGLAVMLPGYLLGQTGAGDVKLVAAVGTLLGPRLTLIAFVYIALAGGVLAALVAARRRRLRASLQNAAALVSTRGASAAAIESPSVDNRFAYAPAIAIGALAAAIGG